MISKLTKCDELGSTSGIMTNGGDDDEERDENECRFSGCGSIVGHALFLAERPGPREPRKQ